MGSKPLEGAGGAGGEAGVVEDELDVGGEGLAAGKVFHAGEELGRGFLAVDAEPTGVGDGLVDGVVDELGIH